MRIKLDNPCEVLSEVLGIYLGLNKYSPVSLRREGNMELKGEGDWGREKRRGRLKKWVYDRRRPDSPVRGWGFWDRMVREGACSG